MRPIDADILTEGIKKYFCNVCSEPEIGKCKACEIAEILSMIDDTPTIEAEPVNHGYWENGWICSECNYGSLEPSMPYCAQCGARMDGDNDD